MAYTTHPTVVTGQTWTAANHNQYVRDNLIEIWRGTTAGDMDYYTSPTTKSRLGIGTAGQVLTSNGTAPTWATPTGLHAIGSVSFAPGGQSTTGTAFVDITGGTLNLTLTRTCTIVMIAVITGYHNTSGRGLIVRGVIDGTADAASSQNFNGAETRNEALPYIYHATGIAAGTRTVKMQFSGDASGTAFVERGRIIALAFSQ